MSIKTWQASAWTVLTSLVIVGGGSGSPNSLNGSQNAPRLSLAISLQALISGTSLQIELVDASGQAQSQTLGPFSPETFENALAVAGAGIDFGMFLSDLLRSAARLSPSLPLPSSWDLLFRSWFNRDPIKSQSLAISVMRLRLRKY